MVVLITGASGGFGRVLGATLAQKGMTVYGTMRRPEGADSQFLERVHAATPLGRMGGTAAVVSTVMFLIGNDFVTGETITVDGGRSLR